MSRIRQMLAFSLATLLTVAVVGPAAAQSDEDRIARVERGLRPATALEGAPVATRTLAEAMAAMHVPGVSVAVIDDGRIVWARGYGTTGRDGAPVTPDTPFQAGSISKAVTAIGALRLAQSGAVALDADVNDRLARWRVPDSPLSVAAPVTLRGLLSHTAGLNGRSFPGYAAGTAVPDLLQVLDGLPPANTPAVRVVVAPGSAWRYSGGGYAVAQLLVEDVAGAPFADWMAAHVLAPAGMTHSSFVEPTPGSVLAHAALPFDAAGQAVAGGPHVYPATAAAGLWSTPSDLARLLIGVQRSLGGGDGGVLTPAMAREMLVPVKPGHGMGFDVGGAPGAGWFAKSGDTEGYAAYMVAYAAGDGVVVMTNGAQGPDLAKALVRSVAAEYGWPDFETRLRAAVAVDPAVLARYVGTYVYNQRNRFTISAEGDHLVIASPGETPERLYAASPADLFTLSQEADFIFDAAPGQSVRSGHIQLPGQAIAFERSEEKSVRRGT